MAELRFVTTIDNDQLRKEAEETSNVLSGISSAARSVGSSMDSGIDGLRSSISQLENELSRGRESYQQWLNDTGDTPFDAERWRDVIAPLSEIENKLVEQRDELLKLEQAQRQQAQSAANAATETYRANIIASSSTDELINRYKDITAEIDAEERALRLLEDQLKDVNREIRRTPAGSEALANLNIRSNLESDIRNTRAGISDLSRTQEEYGQVLRSNGIDTDNLSRATVSFRTQVTQARDRLSELIASGSASNEEIRQAEDEFRKLAVVQREVATRQKALTDSFSGGNLQGAIQGVQALVGAYTAARGVISVFTNDQERQDAIQRQLAQGLSILVGIQQVSNTLSSTSAFRINTVARAQELWTRVQQALTRSTQAATIAARGFAIAITGGLAVAIPVLIGLYNRLRSSQEKARKEQERTQQRIREQNESFANSVGNSVASILTDYVRLQREFISLGDNVRKQERFIKDNQRTFNEWGRSIRTVPEATQLLIEDEENFRRTIDARARAMASLTIATEAYSTSIKNNIINSGLENELELLTNQINELPQTLYSAQGTAGSIVEVGNPEVLRLQKRADEIKQQIEQNSKEIIEAQNIASEAIDENVRQNSIQQDLSNSLAGSVYNPETQRNIKKSYDDALKAFQDYQKEFTSIDQRNIEERNNLRRQGITGIDLLDFDRKKSIEEINNERNALIKLAETYNILAKQTGREEITVDTSIFDQLIENANNRYQIARRNQFNQLLSETASFEQRRIALIEDSERRIRILQEETSSALLDGEIVDYSGNIAEIERQLREALSGLRREQLESDTLWQSLFGNLETSSTETIQRIIESARQQLAEITDLTPEAVRALVEGITNAERIIIQRNPFKALSNAYRNYRNAVKNNAPQEEIDRQFQLLSESAEESIDDINSIGNAFIELGAVFGEDVSPEIGFMTSLVDTSIEVFQLLGNIGAASTGDIIAGVTAIINVVGSLVSLFDNSAEKEARAAERRMAYQEQTNRLLERYIKILDTASGSEYFDAQNNALEILRKNIEQVESSLRLALRRSLFQSGNAGAYQLRDSSIEDILSYFDNADNYARASENIREYVDLLREYRQELVDLDDDIAERTFQTTRDSLEDAIVEGIRGGQGAIDDLGGYFEDVMRDALIQAWVLSEGGLRQEIDKFYERYEDLYGDGDLSESDIEELRRRWQELLDNAREQAEGIGEILGTVNDDSRTAVSQGISTASQDSIDELNGRFTVIQGHTFQITNNTNEILRLMQTETANSNQYLIHLSAIHTNTDNLPYIRTAVENMDVRGVTLRT